MIEDPLSAQAYQWLCDEHLAVTKKLDLEMMKRNTDMKIAYVCSEEHLFAWDTYNDILEPLDIMKPDYDHTDCNGHRSFFKDKSVGADWHRNGNIKTFRVRHLFKKYKQPDAPKTRSRANSNRNGYRAGQSPLTQMLSVSSACFECVDRGQGKAVEALRHSPMSGNLPVDAQVQEQEADDYMRFLPVLTDKQQGDEASIIDISDVNMEEKEEVAQSTNYDAGEKPAYFVQITQVHEEEFTLRLDVLDVNSTKKRKFKIATTDGQQLDEVTVKRKQLFGTQDVEFDEEHDGEYQIAIYDLKGDDTQPLSNIIQLHRTKQRNPQPIDIATVCKVLDSGSETMFMYWNTPKALFGDISYMVLCDNEIKDVDVEGLPQSMPLSLLPLRIQIVTVCSVDGQQSFSEPSPVFEVGEFAPISHPSSARVNQEDTTGVNSAVVGVDETGDKEKHDSIETVIEKIAAARLDPHRPSFGKAHSGSRHWFHAEAIHFMLYMRLYSQYDGVLKVTKHLKNKELQVKCNEYMALQLDDLVRTMGAYGSLYVFIF